VSYTYTYQDSNLYYANATYRRVDHFHIKQDVLRLRMEEIIV